MSRKKILWILPVLVLVAAAGGYYFLTARAENAATSANSENQMQTAVARRGELTILASGAGQLIPADEISIGFDESGTLIELHVKVGDKVSTGDVLGYLQTSKTEQEIALSISEAELNVIEAQQGLDELYANAEIARTTALSDISTYAQEVRDAQYQLENYSLPIYLQDLDPVAALDQMKAELDAASKTFEPYRYYSPDNTTRKELLEDLNTAQNRYDAAVKRLNYEYALQVAQANLEKARQEYGEVENGPAADELALAQAQLANAEASLAMAQEEQAVVELLSPIDGTVLEVTASTGEALSSGAFVTLADLDQPLLEVYLDETDLGSVAVGYAAEVVFDALPDRTFQGQVVTVSPSLETVGNVQAVRVEVLLEAVEAKVSLPVGLSASVDVIAGQTENAVLVPVEALRELGPDEYAVFVVEDGEPKLRLVTVGLMDVTSAEITSGLEAGEVVSTGIVQAE